MKRALKKFGWALLGLFILFQIYFSVRVYWLVFLYDSDFINVSILGWWRLHTCFCANSRT